MGSGLIAILLLAGASPTNFNIRTVPHDGRDFDPPAQAAAPLVAPRPFDLNAVSRLASQWGRVTSTLRSVDHNRAVGGVPNSFHLSGRAIDIARFGNVSHGQIAAAYRKAGYFLIESLDEGDHSHFAFSTAPASRMKAPVFASVSTNWGVRYAPGR